MFLIKVPICMACKTVTFGSEQARSQSRNTSPCCKASSTDNACLPSVCCCCCCSWYILLSWFFNADSKSDKRLLLGTISANGSSSYESFLSDETGDTGDEYPPQDVFDLHQL